MSNRHNGPAVSIILVIMWLGIKLPLMVCYYTLIGAAYIIREALNGGRITRLRIQRRYLIAKSRR